MTEPCRVLVLYDHGEQLAILAQEIATGIGNVADTEVVLRTAQQAKREDLLTAEAIIIGTPNWTEIKGTRET